MTHPSLGHPPLDPTAGSADAAAPDPRPGPASWPSAPWPSPWIADPTLRERNDDAGLRARLHDATLLVEQVALSVAAADPTPAREYADWTSPVYRRKRVPLGDLVALCEGLRVALPTMLAPLERGDAEAALDAAIAQYRWHGRLAGDARKKNAFLQFIYKGG